jgi:hypothetical protein
MRGPKLFLSVSARSRPPGAFSPATTMVRVAGSKFDCASKRSVGAVKMS